MAENVSLMNWSLTYKMIFLALAMGLLRQGNTADVTANPRNFLTNPPDYPLTVENKIVTCNGRCGEDTRLPCSCHPKCFVYKNCCENINLDCPHLNRESFEKYGRLRDTEVVCSDYRLFMILTCQDSIIIKKRDVEELSDLDYENEMESNDYFQTLGENISKTEYPRGISNTNKIGLDPGVSNPEQLINARPTEDSDDLLNSQNEDDDIIMDILTQAPVYDSSTGLLYLNSRIFYCNGGKKSNLMLWRAQIKLLTKDGITNFKDIEDRLEMSSLTYIPPPSKDNSQLGDPCYYTRTDCDSVDYVINSWCRNFISYVMIEREGPIVYKNRFCVQCEHGDDVFYPVYIPNLRNDIVDLDRDFSVLFSFSTSNSLSVVFVDERNPEEEEQWADLNCYINGAPRDERRNCPVRICDRFFVPGPDGTCKVLHNTLIAFSEDKFPLTSNEKSRASQILMCGLKMYLNIDAVNTNRPLLIQNNEYLNQTIYVANMSIYLPSLDPITTKDLTLSENVTALFRFLKTFRELRKPPLDSVCELEWERKEFLDTNDSSRVDYAGFQTVTFLNVSKKVDGNMSKGQAISDTVTTFCLSSSPADLDPVNELVCHQEPIYQSELQTVLEICKSSCFSDFMKKNTKSGGTAEFLAPFPIVTLVVIAMVLP